MSHSEHHGHGGGELKPRHHPHHILLALAILVILCFLVNVVVGPSLPDTGPDPHLTKVGTYHEQCWPIVHRVCK